MPHAVALISPDGAAGVAAFLAAVSTIAVPTSSVPTSSRASAVPTSAVFSAVIAAAPTSAVRSTRIPTIVSTYAATVHPAARLPASLATAGMLEPDDVHGLANAHGLLRGRQAVRRDRQPSQRPAVRPPRQHHRHRNLRSPVQSAVPVE